MEVHTFGEGYLKMNAPESSVGLDESGAVDYRHLLLRIYITIRHIGRYMLIAPDVFTRQGIFVLSIINLRGGESLGRLPS